MAKSKTYRQKHLEEKKRRKINIRHPAKLKGNGVWIRTRRRVIRKLLSR